MPLDKKGLVERARKAGSASAVKRREKTVPRDERLVLAYKYLKTGMYLSPKDKNRAVEFLVSKGLKPYPPENVSILTYLATAVDLSEDRLQRILRKALKYY
jgi:hypothetical protein